MNETCRSRVGQLLQIEAKYVAENIKYQVNVTELPKKHPSLVRIKNTKICHYFPKTHITTIYIYIKQENVQ